MITFKIHECKTLKVSFILIYILSQKQNNKKNTLYLHHYLIPWTLLLCIH